MPPVPDHHPNILATDHNGLFCFLNAQRPCGPDCMAFVAPLDGPDYKDQQWANCLLLTNAHRGGKHLVLLAVQGQELLQRTKTAAADAARANQPPPPKGG